MAIPNPTRTDIDVLKAASNMTELMRSEELCWMDPELAAACKIAIGDQIRLKRNTSNYAVYTVSAFHQEGPGNDDVRLGPDGRKKLGTTTALSNISMFTEGNILRSDLSDADAKSQSEFVERLTDSGHNGLVASAPHGGGIELYTDRQAERVWEALPKKGVTSWRCKGWKEDGGAFDRWHIQATRISRRCFPLLDSIGDRGFKYSVCFHGWSSGGILIGGRGTMDLKQQIQAKIIAAMNDASIAVTIADADDADNGDDPKNLVNWLAADKNSSIQLEQSLPARTKYWQQIADAVASVFYPLIPDIL
jgi:phage replication-related protein YjqB (UPF0714/DUF867 family)